MALFGHLKMMLGSSRVDLSRRFTFLRSAVLGTRSKFYVARDMQTNTVVGVKILDPVKFAAFESRFKGLGKPCEGEIAARLNHPHIVRTLEHGLTTEDWDNRTWKPALTGLRISWKAYGANEQRAPDGRRRLY
jgi:hypothetical protein